MFVPSGVTPPPIISAIEPVTTTLGNAGSRVRWARFIACSVPCWPSSASDNPVTTIGKLVGRQRVGVVQHRRDRQVLAPDGAVDDHLQSLHRGEDVDGAPISAGAIVIENQHHTGSSTLEAAAFLASCFLRNSGRSFGISSQMPAA